MSRRRGSLFPRTLGDVVKKATQPLMDQQGKLYGALLRDWATIVGPERARTTRPQCLKWPNAQADGAVLHLDVAAAIAPELAYETEQLLEKCARYFGYRAIARVVIHPNHEMGGQKTDLAKSPRERREAIAQHAQPSEATKTNHVGSPADMMDILQRMRQRIAGGDKRDESR
jgi:hypothetical protein